MLNSRTVRFDKRRPETLELDLSAAPLMAKRSRVEFRLDVKEVFPNDVRDSGERFSNSESNDEDFAR